METTRILIVEDEALFRDLLCRTLSKESQLLVTGEAGDGETAIRLFEETKPDVVLVDIELPGNIDGIDVAVHVKKHNPEVGIVILSSHSDQRYVLSLPLRESGGWAYLLKQTVSGIGTLMNAIEKTRSGMIVLDPQIANGLRARQTSPVARLSPSRLEVLKLIAQGYNNTAVASQLNLSAKSVENYINDIYQELGLKDMAALHARVKATLLYLESS